MVHRAGTLDTRVTLQRKTSSQSPSGDITETWATIGQRWSAYKPITGSEVNVLAQWVAKEQVEFTIRWDKDVSLMTPLDRIVCPAADADATTIQNRSIYDVITVHFPDLNDTIRILAARRSDI